MQKKGEVGYVINSDGAARGIFDALSGRFTCREEPGTRLRVTYLDTFDWSLRRAGLALCGVDSPSGVLLTLDSLEGGDARIARMARLPSFAWDLPAGEVRDRLEPVITVRRLFKVLKVGYAEPTLRIMGKREKTVARVVVERSRPGGGDGPICRKLPLRLVLVPVRGYEKSMRQVTLFFQQELGMESFAAGHPLVMVAPEAAELEAISGPLLIPLERSMRTDEASKRVFQHLLQSLVRYEGGTRKDLDSEFLHAFRVAVRRTRAGLARVNGVFSEATLKRYSRDFSWLGMVTSRVRDLDVYLLKMPEFKKSVPKEIRADLKPLKKVLQQRRNREFRKVVRALATARYERLKSSWTEFLEKPVPEQTQLKDATRPVGQVASERIWKIYKRVLGRGGRITPESPAIELHRLRLDAKKLRYLMEFFRALYDEEEVARLILSMKSLQDNLGDFNDLEVQQLALRGIAEELTVKRRETARTLMAMGRLIERLERRHSLERDRFALEFEQFSCPEMVKLAKRLFGRGAEARRRS
ncbi:MAG: CHAD domain-containing protein [Planctomycetota bacterium]